MMLSAYRPLKASLNPSCTGSIKRYLEEQKAGLNQGKISHH
jgi:hypothetical protein